MRRALVVVGLAFLAVMTGAATNASADETPPDGTVVETRFAWPWEVVANKDCKTAPMADSPNKLGDTGPAGNTDTGAGWKPEDGKPIPGNYNKFGFGGLRVVAYDQGVALLGCGQVNPAKGVAQGLTDAGTQIAVLLGSFTTSAWRWATDGTLTGLVTPIQSELTKSTGRLLAAFLAIPVLAMGAWFIAKSGSLRTSDVGKYVGTAILIVVTGVTVVLYSLVLAPTFVKGACATLAFTANQINVTADRPDPTFDDAVGAYNQAGPSTAGDAIGALIVDKVLHPMWLNQTFGAENKAAQDKYGSRLKEAATLTRAEATLIEGDPSAAKTIYENKAGAYRVVAGQIEVEFPAAYAHVAGGDDVWDAWTQGLLGVLALLAVVVFLLAALFEVVLGLLAVSFVAGLAPLIALASIHPVTQPIFWRALGFVKDRCLKAFVAAVGVFLWASCVVGPVLNAPVPLLAKMMALGVSVVVMRRLQKVGLGNIKGTHQKMRRVKRQTERTAHRVEKGAQTVAHRGGQAGDVAVAAGHGAVHAGWAAAKGSSNAFQSAAGGVGRKVTGRVQQAGGAPTTRGQAVAAGAKQGAVKAVAAGVATGGTATVAVAAAGAVKGATRGAARQPADATPVHRPVEPSRVRRRDAWHAKRTQAAPERIAHHAPVDPR